MPIFKNMDRKSLILNIIPLKPLPFKAPDCFTYFTNFSIPEGSLVEIELRKKICLGYVDKILPLERSRAFLKETKIELKQVKKLINSKPVIFEYQKTLASWLKNYYAISLPHAYSLFFPYPKILSKFKKEREPKIEKKNKKIVWLKSLEELKQIKNKKILFLLPDEILIFDWLQKLKEINENILYFHSKLSQKEKVKFFEKILNQEKNWFLVSKRGIFFPYFELQSFVIINEGSFFYKEYFKPPYFDYRTIIYKLGDILSLPIYVLDEFPSFRFFIKSKEGLPKININFEVLRSLSEVENIISEFKKFVVFAPQKLISHKLICEFCWQTLKCPKDENDLWFNEKRLFCSICLKNYPLPEKCPFCSQETNFLLEKLGLQGIFSYLKDKIKVPVFIIKNEKDYASLDFDKIENFALFGSFVLLQRVLPSLDAFFFFNFNQFFYTRDIFLREKFYRLLYHFSRISQKAFLVSEKTPPSLNLIKSGKILKELLRERRLENLPPYKRLIKLIYSLSNLKELQQRTLNIRKILEKNSNIEINGPIFAYPEKIRKKYFLEILLKTNYKDFNLYKILEDLPYLEKLDSEADSL
jgi:primosomal protein N'